MGDLGHFDEDGFLTLGYQSSNYFTERVPELGVADLPFLFPDVKVARGAMDGRLGQVLTAKLEAVMNYRILGGTGVNDAGLTMNRTGSPAILYRLPPIAFGFMMPAGSQRSLIARSSSNPRSPISSPR